ncbi:hypothetical protein QE152_g65 [Popillia japonica]|uniref:Uncharacterized protein n=1 Tax=Popillia japonica TaxID=7064 RepID=A0AAW1NKX2_POPJA
MIDEAKNYVHALLLLLFSQLPREISEIFPSFVAKYQTKNQKLHLVKIEEISEIFPSFVAKYQTKNQKLHLVKIEIGEEEMEVCATGTRNGFEQIGGQKYGYKVGGT